MLYVSVPAFISQVLVNAPNSLVKRTIWGLLGATKDGVPALPRSRVAQGRQGFVLCRGPQREVPPCTRPPFLAHHSELRGNSAGRSARLESSRHDRTAAIKIFFFLAASDLERRCAARTLTNTVLGCSVPSNADYGKGSGAQRKRIGSVSPAAGGRQPQLPGRGQQGWPASRYRPASSS